VCWGGLSTCFDLLLQLRSRRCRILVCGYLEEQKTCQAFLAGKMSYSAGRSSPPDDRTPMSHQRAPNADAGVLERRPSKPAPRRRPVPSRPDTLGHDMNPGRLLQWIVWNIWVVWIIWSPYIGLQRPPRPVVRPDSVYLGTTQGQKGTPGVPSGYPRLSQNILEFRLPESPRVRRRTPPGPGRYSEQQSSRSRQRIPAGATADLACRRRYQTAFSSR